MVKKLITRVLFILKYRTLKKIAEEATGKLVICGASTIVKIPSHCPHQGAPLKNAEVRGDKVVCMWHGCSFSLKEKKWIYPKKFQCNTKEEVNNATSKTLTN